MNGFGARPGDGYGPGRLAPAQPIGPNGKILMEGYKKEVLGGFEKERPRYNQMNGNRPQSSPLVDLDDPIQVHLLVETALSDSRKYQILSQEEVDSIKKQVQSLSMRIEQARANLAIQSKYRDAAISMTKLYSPGRPESRRRSLMGNNRLSDQAKEADMERQISEKRCEELATELFSLEKCLMEPQRKLLEHTCAILQLTHRASSKKSGQPQAGQIMTNGIPGSPESLYTYSNARNSLEPPGDDGFDDRSLYLPLDQMDGPQTRPRKNTIEIPLKSPVREQNQLRGEMDRMKEENIQLSSLTDEQRRIISDTERKLETLNIRLRDVVITFNPAENEAFPEPSPSSGSGETLNRQLEYLEMGLSAASEEQKYVTSDNSKDPELQARADEAISARVEAEERVQELNRQVHELLLQSNPNAPPPDATASLDNKFDYLENAFQSIQGELERAADLSSSATAKKQTSDQVETVLMGLWDIIQAGFAEIQQQKVARRQTRANMNLPPDEDDMSGDEAVDPNEAYSLQAFSAKVQWLYAQATSLKEQKSVLKRQIKQQRELNNKSDAEKDQEVQAKTEELEKLKLLLDDSELAAKDARDKLAEALNNLDALQKASEANESTSARAVQEQTRTAQDQLKERSAKIVALEAECKDREAAIATLEGQCKDQETAIVALESTLAALESQSKAQDVTISQLEGTVKDTSSRLEASEGNLAAVQAKLSEAGEAKAAAEAKVEELTAALKQKEEELEQMNVMIIELKTEVTIAKAELDGAYGSRAQRAAEVAALSKSSETTGLNQQVANLKAELASTLRDFEEMTKESIAAEKEKLDLESQLDDALSVKQGLETEVKALRDRLDREVGRLKEELDKEKLRVPPSPGPGALGPGGVGASRAGASMLSEQFRATMKEERKKFQEELREEQARRRKLEDEIRLLKKSTPGAGIGRSPLGPLSPVSRS